MKIIFSTKNVARSSFLDLCRYAYDYGYAGFEIYDALKERAAHHDSILRRDKQADSTRKLINRGLSVGALRMNESLESEEVTSSVVLKYVNMAAMASVPYVIVRAEKEIPFEALKEKMADAISVAEKTGV